MVLIKNLLKFYSHKIQNAKYFITFLFLNYFLVKKHIPIFIWLLLLAELGQNSPFLEGVPAIAGGVVSASHGRISSQNHRRSSHNATLVFFHKLSLMRKSTPLKKGNLYRSAIKCLLLQNKRA